MNYRVTALTLQKHNRQRVNVYLDGEFAFGLARILAAWLQVGQEVSNEKISQLQAEDAREVAYQRALKFLNYRPRTEAEVRKNLTGHDVSEEVSDHVLERLKQSGLIDDANFARLWVENRAELRPRSRRALVYELRQRGVNEQIIEQSLGSIDEEKMAFRLARNKARKYNSIEWNEFRHKMYRFLSQRGFDSDAIIQAINRAWEEVSDKNQIIDEEANL